MISRTSSLDEIKAVVRECLQALYKIDTALFERKKQKGMSERCLVFRFAHYLQNKLEGSFFVDCDFNSSFVGHYDAEGNFITTERAGKIIPNQDGTFSKRLIDIIVHRREATPDSDFICFEFKQWYRDSVSALKKDKNNLEQLTSTYGYLYGFHVIFGQTKETSRWTIFQNGRAIETDAKIF